MADVIKLSGSTGMPGSAVDHGNGGGFVIIVHVLAMSDREFE
jgi:hypothetical protein